MTFVEIHTASCWALLVILCTLLVQWVVASGIKARQPGAIPGKLPEHLSHDSLIFRAHRTFHNSLENLPLLLGTAFLAFFIGTSPRWTAILLWLYAIARIVHMVLYYRIATEKNPSPRSYFFMIGFCANIGLLILCAITLLKY